MIKKFMILTILSLFSIVLFAQEVNAESVLVTEPAANTGGLWHVEDGNRVYINGRYTEGETVYESGSVVNPTYTGYDYSNYLFFDVGVEDVLDFTNTTTPKTATISNPDPSIYDSFHVEITTSMNIVNGAPPTVVEIADYNTAVNEITIDLNDWADRPFQGPEVYYIYDYSWMDLYADGIKIFTSRNSSSITENAIGIPENPNYMDLLYGWGIRMYWESSTTGETIDPGTSDSTEDPWNPLPETTGSPVNPIGDWGTVSNISVSNQTVSFNIEYLGVTYPVNSFTVDGDLDFINKANDVLYYSDPNTGDKLLYFNFGDTLDSAILAARSFSTVNVWNGEALWNLTQNEIKVTDVLRVYNYIPDVDSDGNVYSYFYMPDVPIDNLISVSSVLAYRYWDDGIFGIGDPSPGDTQYRTVTATKGESSSVNPTWVETAYKHAYITSAVAGVITATVSWVPIYGWAVAGAAFFAGAALNVADVTEFFAYDVNQIDHVIPSVSLTNEINNFILETSGADSFSADTDKLYKLHLATLQDGDEVEIMNELSNVTQVVWETDGEIFVVNEENIEDIWGGPGTLEPDDAADNDMSVLIYIGIGIVGVMFFSKLKLDKKPGLVMIIIAGVIYFLYTNGMI
jgi:hypothetical protein